MPRRSKLAVRNAGDVVRLTTMANQAEQKRFFYTFACIMKGVSRGSVQVTSEHFIILY